MQIYPGIGITLIEPITVLIDKEYFRERIQKVLMRYDWDTYIDPQTKTKEILEEIMKVFEIHNG